MTITPDVKNWTWVIHERCPECGFDGAAYDPLRAARDIRAMATAWQQILLRADVSERPDPQTWSPLEYACHIRDVFRVYDGRLHRMLIEDGPRYENWDQDATAVEERYDQQQTTAVAVELAAAAARLADRYDTVPDDGWSRTGHRSDGSSFTIDSFTRYLLHDLVHHVHDVAPR